MHPIVLKLCLSGGLFALLCLIHLFVDFVCQTHFEAMNKHNNSKIRARHCLIYTLGFIPILLLCNHLGALSLLELFLCVNILFWSHFVEDTYFLVFLWAKIIRRPPEMTEPRKIIEADGYVSILPPDPKAGFVDFIQTILGKILMISIDQIIHFVFLLPVVYMILN